MSRRNSPIPPTRSSPIRAGTCFASASSACRRSAIPVSRWGWAGGRPSALSVQGGDAVFQQQFAEAEAKFRAARALCYETWQDVSETISRSEPVARRQFTLTRLALNHVTTVVADICTFAHKTGGGVSLRSGVLQRCFRDMFAATQHRIVSDIMLRECGRELLGTADDKLWSTRGLVDAYIA